MTRSKADTIEIPGGLSPAEAIPDGLTGRWYVGHTRARNEKLLAHEMGRLAIPNYLPLTQRVTRGSASRRVSRSVVPVFPGYIFFNATEEQRYLALRTNRIANILTVASEQQLIDELRRIHFLLTHTDQFRVANRLKIGDWGRVIAGPLAGLEGVITRYTGGLRLTMNVTILGQSAHVEVDSDNIEKIAPPDYLPEAERRGPRAGPA
jgi:transcription antitermination factor NusG